MGTTMNHILYLTTNTVIKSPGRVVVNETITNPDTGPDTLIGFMEKFKSILYTLFIFCFSTLQIRHNYITLKTKSQMTSSAHAVRSPVA